MSTGIRDLGDGQFSERSSVDCLENLPSSATAIFGQGSIEVLLANPWRELLRGNQDPRHGQWSWDGKRPIRLAIVNQWH